MSTNYYAIKPCAACGHAKTLYIGKSAAGWFFALHVEPDAEDHPSDLAEWEALFRDPQWQIRDEYDEPLSADEMIRVIRDRSGVRTESWRPDSDRVPGPSGLWRQRADDESVRHGEGTWDLVTGEFS